MNKNFIGEKHGTNNGVLGVCWYHRTGWNQRGGLNALSSLSIIFSTTLMSCKQYRPIETVLFETLINTMGSDMRPMNSSYIKQINGTVKWAAKERSGFADPSSTALFCVFRFSVSHASGQT